MACSCLSGFDSIARLVNCLELQLKVYGKRGVHKDTKLQDVGGQILEKDGILYNCAFSLSDKGAGLNEYGSDLWLTIVNFHSIACW